MPTLYGLPNCDSCRKARKWFEARNLDYEFHDVREDGVGRELLERWLDPIDWQTLLNTRSTTWRSLDAADKADLDRNAAIELMIAHPTLIKRPVIASGDVILVGYSEASYVDNFG